MSQASKHVQWCIAKAEKEDLNRLLSHSPT